MTDSQSRRGEDTSEMQDEEYYPEFFVSREQADMEGRSLQTMIINRMSYTDRQKYEDADQNVDDLVPQIVESSSQDSDFLLPDTPLKEAVFRVMLASGNVPVTAEQISEYLSERWAMTPYPRDVSPKVIQRLLENSAAYCIAQMPQAEPDSDEEAS